MAEDESRARSVRALWSLHSAEPLSLGIQMRQALYESTQSCEAYSSLSQGTFVRFQSTYVVREGRSGSHRPTAMNPGSSAVAPTREDARSSRAGDIVRSSLHSGRIQNLSVAGGLHSMTDSHHAKTGCSENTNSALAVALQVRRELCRRTHRVYRTELCFYRAETETELQCRALPIRL